MNVKVYAGGALACDNLLPVEKGYTMQSILIRERKNTGGSATLLLPPQHPLRDGFPAFRTPVEIYCDGVLRWRGRALPESRDFHCRGTIACEGELCFLQDSILRPGTYSGDLATVFTRFIEAHNSKVEEWKRFAVGNITVTVDEDVEIQLKTGSKTYAEIQNLVNTYGGIILFDSAPDGARRINWYAAMPYSCNQRIALGKNLIDYSSSVDATRFATRIIPYGAEDANGNPITINIDGKDYVENAEGVALRGVIEASVPYPDISDPEELRAAAQRDVDKAATLPETIKLSAVDASRQGLILESFRMGQRVNAESAPHKLSGYYDLVAIEEDLVNPGAGGITLTKDSAYYDGTGSTLTGAVSSQGKQDPQKQFASFLTTVAKLTSAILGAEGGCVRLLDTNGDRYPDELYIADDPDISKAVNVWRLNYMGLAASSNGYNGPFELGMALGVGIVADFITAGTLNAALVKVINLIADHLLSVKGNSQLEIDGASINFKMNGKETLDIRNWDDGVPFIYMTSYDAGGNVVNRGQFGADRASVGGTWANPEASLTARQKLSNGTVARGSQLLVDEITENPNDPRGLKFIGESAFPDGILVGSGTSPIKEIRVGVCRLNCSSKTTVKFSIPMAEGLFTPMVVLTPFTSTAGVIAAKVTAADNTGFTAVIGGSGFSDIYFNYIAFAYP